MIDKIFIKHETDKSSLSHNYSPYYDMMFAPYREQTISLLELGVYSGASCRAWKDYFPKANIFGVDLEYKPQYNEDRIFMIAADQSKPEDLKRLAEVQHDIIVDDASHRSIDQIESFKALFPSMKAGGMYVIEDILCAYDERWNREANVIDYIRELVGDVQMNGKVPGSRLCANKPEQVKLYPTDKYQEAHVEFILVAMGLCFIKKMS